LECYRTASINLHGAAADEADGALPPADDIDVIKDLASGGTDEGRAMMQIIHDIAPGGSLAFYTAFSTASRTSPMAQLTAMTQYLTELAHNAGLSPRRVSSPRSSRSGIILVSSTRDLNSDD
jgi:hypothetical protein